MRARGCRESEEKQSQGFLDISRQKTGPLRRQRGVKTREG